MSISTLPLLAKVSAVYGSSYAGLISAFAVALVPDFEPPEELYENRNDDEYGDDEYDDEEYDDEDYDDEEYDDEDYEDYDEDDDEYSDTSDYVDNIEVDDSNGGAGSLKVQVNVLKEVTSSGGGRSIPIRNGDTLTENDNYKVQMRCNVECYAYIAQLDSTGRMDPILPSKLVDIQNPLYPETSYSAPQADNWFYLDASRGVEQIYFIFSETPREDIELIFKQLSQANANLVRKKDVSIEKPMLLTRGIAGVRKGMTQAISLSNGDQGQYVSTILESIEADLVITKWFRHD